MAWLAQSGAEIASELNTMAIESQTKVHPADRRRPLFFGMLILLIMLIVSSVSGYLSVTLQREEEKRFTSTIGTVLSESIKRISFSGKYHTRLLLEELQKKLPEIAYISVETIDGIVEAHTDSTKNDTFINQEEKTLNLQVLEESSAHLRDRIIDTHPVKEVLLTYHKGIEASPTGIIRIGVKVGEIRSKQRNNLLIHLLMIIILTVASVWIVEFISRYFSRRLILSEQALRKSEGELRRSANHLRTLIHTIPDLIWLKDAEGVYLSCNYTFERFFGARSADIIGKTDYDFVDRELADFFRAHDRRAIAAGKPSLNEEWVTFADDGHRALLETIKTPMFDGEGVLIGVLGIGHDITARKRAEEEIHKLNQELEQLVHDRTAQFEATNKELESFAYTVSHDLRAPLRHIDGFMELLQERISSTLDEQSQHYMTTILNAGKKMGVLIDDLLSFSRMGRHNLSKTEVNLGPLVQEVMQELEPDLKKRTINWHVTDLPVVYGDHALLRIVLVNLLSNAIKFTRLKPIAEIEIGCLSNQEKEDTLFIRDNGAGFDMTYVDKLFGVFHRLHRQEDFEGTGIGLANVRRIIDLHGGRVWAEGEIEKGATFYFALPQPKGEVVNRRRLPGET